MKLLNAYYDKYRSITHKDLGIEIEIPNSMTPMSNDNLTELEMIRNNIGRLNPFDLLSVFIDLDSEETDNDEF